MSSDILSELENMSAADLLKAMRESKEKTKKFLVLHNSYEQFFADLWSELFSGNKFDAQSDFFELGGTSLQAVLILSRIKEHYNVEPDLVDLFKATTIETQAKLVEALVSNGLHYQTEYDYQKDIDQINTIDLAGVKEYDNKVGRVFLTGATGFLGIHLLKELLKNPDVNVVCLVRADTPSKGKERVLLCAQKYQIAFDSKEKNRISCLCGNLEKEQLGLSEKEYSDLTGDIDLIIHSAAMVNFVYSYDSLRKANVQSLYEIIKIAATVKIKPIHFVSSVGVFNSLVAKNVEIIDEDTVLTDDSPISGYFQTKWVCEQMCLKARAKGIPVSVYRPSGITMNSQTKVTCDDDLTYVFLKLCKNIAAFPNVGALTDIVPVDYVAQSVVQLSRDYPSAQNNYHLTSGKLVSAEDLSSQLMEYSIAEIINYDEYLKRVLVFIQNSEDAQLKKLVPLITSKEFSPLRPDKASSVFQNKKTSQLLRTVINPDIKSSFQLLLSQI